ncbi:hypothetical protein BAZ12_18020 [Elizabethkingia miricola]|uniref:Putative auto-transporter adhesin head GIN domain-containing protein n=1 Tax=Elizabethkingia miricola TaxID=172045 RepID=A0AAP1BUC6_ELIMR|nr:MULTISPECIES: head GIN domain-containing protein [Elizabethkingia]KUY17269.1 hypothetical protein ATB95_12945 [Elizabethkingia miricola]MCL1654442.1 DUF2807 domain-containing protein [Elizabethkingia miricola]MCL1671486.1 DUF2807 domain-containing protein [Elizabethkingia ursingii]MDX8569429.1 DUF2807 domain-containing protein [Elizabethkingia sp. HX XZB]OPC34511.1 hypothetical protein BAX99_06455 [Elizabethkingia miricola]
MKKILLPLVITGSVVTSCIIVKASDDGYTGRNSSYIEQAAESTVSETKTFNVQNFNGVKTSMAIKVEVVKSDIEKAVATSNYMEFLRVENRGGVLNVYYEIPRGNNGLRNANTTVIVYAKNISDLRASSAGKILIKDQFNTSTLNIDVSSAGKVQYENIKANRLNLGLSSAATFTGSADVQSVNADVSSAATINISGKAGDVRVDASSSADFNGSDLRSGIVKAQASSAGKIKIGVIDELTAAASSGAKIYYKSPSGIRLNVRKSSGGKVEAL